MYFLTVKKDGAMVIRRQPFESFEAALAATSQYYRAKVGRCILSFTTEVVDGKILVSYATLRKSQDISPKQHYYLKACTQAVKDENAFIFDGSYLFSIQSEMSIEEVDNLLADDDH